MARRKKGKTGERECLRKTIKLKWLDTPVVAVKRKGAVGRMKIECVKCRVHEAERHGSLSHRVIRRGWDGVREGL